VSIWDYMSVSDVVNGVLEAYKTKKKLDTPNPELEKLKYKKKLLEEGLEDKELEDNARIGQETGKTSGYTGETFSSKEQTDEDYCLECVSSHLAEAYAMLDEALRLCRDRGRLNEDGKRRVRRALHAIKGIPYDLDSVNASWSEEILSDVRNIRKQYILPAKSNPENLDALREGKQEIEELEGKVDELMEEHGKSEEKSETEKELIEERKSKRESGEDVEDKVRENLKKYLDTGEKEYLEKADKYAKRGTCGACVRSVERPWKPMRTVI